MATKRPADDQPGGSGGPPNKKLTRFEPVNIGPVYSLEELDVKVLQFQNKKLTERIEQRKRSEDELRKRIEQLENRQRTDDAVLMIVNRYWNQVDEDVRVLLQRFDAETADEIETKNESDETTAFLTLLSTWDKQELEQKLGQRVEFSKRAIGKLLQAFDRLLQRNEKLNIAIQGKIEKEDEGMLDLPAIRKDSEIKMETEIKKEPEEPEPSVSVSTTENIEEKPEVETTADEQATEPVAKKEEEIKEEIKQESEETVPEQKPELPSLRETVKEELGTLQKENRRLHNQVTHLHQRHHETTLKVAESQDKLTAAETEIAELKNQIDDLEYNLGNSQQRAEKLDRHLSEAYQKLHNFDEKSFISFEGGKSISGVPKNRFEEMIHELEEQREMATNRMTELEKLTKDHQEAMMQIEQLKMDLQHLPEHVIVDIEAESKRKGEVNK